MALHTVGFHPAALGSTLRLGPFEPYTEGMLTRLLPLLFYASILLVVGLWLRPLLTDLRVLTEAAQKFASDYREPLDTAHRVKAAGARHCGPATAQPRRQPG